MMYLVEIPQYDLHIKVFNTKRSIVRYLNKVNYAIPHDFDTVHGTALLYTEMGIDLLLYLAPDADEDVLDHELIHMTWHIAKVTGQQLTYTNDEFQAYLFTDLKRKIKKKIWKKQ
jgi:hypothetical protein